MEKGQLLPLLASRPNQLGPSPSRAAQLAPQRSDTRARAVPLDPIGGLRGRLFPRWRRSPSPPLSRRRSGQGDGARRPGRASPPYKSSPRAPPRCPRSIPPLNSAAAAPHRQLGTALFRHGAGEQRPNSSSSSPVRRPRAFAHPPLR